MAITELKTTIRKKTKNSLDALNSGNYRTDQQNLPNLNNRKKKKRNIIENNVSQMDGTIMKRPTSIHQRPMKRRERVERRIFNNG